MPPTPDEWDVNMAAHPAGHLLQTTPWGRLKSEFGWAAEVVAPTAAAGALVLYRRLPLGLCLAYVPRGPVLDWADPAALPGLLPALAAAARKRGALCLKLEPGLNDTPAHIAWLTGLGLRPSPHTVQPRRSLVIDLRPAEPAILAAMKPKTRYNIGLAAKKGVTVRRAPTELGQAAASADVERFIALMAETGRRDGFGVHAPEYYRRAFALFAPSGQAVLALAEYQGAALAGVMAFALGKQAWYFYGASSDQERARMAPYLAQWEALRWARAQGAETYDLWGVPDADEAELEAGFEARRDGLWGVYRFKRGWGGRLTRTVGAWDWVYNPLLYRAYVLYLQRRGGHNLG
ncbi:MAG: peptidoglycan bridge formation glycyltransferase FemA/FemB family protein [Anaerolineales bacterium]|nr:peptidoglycan bridge formation glycyltransferase FemA/FemB family protein [Anaerolineales bacterium]